MADGPDREVDSGGEDDQRLADRKSGDDRRLLDDDRERAGLGEPRVEMVKMISHHQHHQWAERGMGVQQVLHALDGGLLTLGRTARPQWPGVGVDGMVTMASLP